MKDKLSKIVEFINSDEFTSILAENEVSTEEVAIDEADESDTDEDETSVKGPKGKVSKGGKEDKEDAPKAEDDEDDDEDDEDDSDKEEVKESFISEINDYIDNISFSEDIAHFNTELFEGALTEEDLKKLSDILEMSHKAKLRESAEKLVENLVDYHETRLALEVESVETYLTEKTSQFVEMKLKKWEEDNKAPLTEQRMVDAAKAMFTTMTEALKEFGVDVNIDEEIEGRIEALQEEAVKTSEMLETAFEQISEANEQNEALQKKIIFMEATNDFDTKDVRILENYANEIRYKDLNEYAKKLDVLIESVVDKEDHTQSLVEDFEYTYEDNLRFIEETVETEETIEESEYTDPRIEELVREMV